MHLIACNDSGGCFQPSLLRCNNPLIPHVSQCIEALGFLFFSLFVRGALVRSTEQLPGGHERASSHYGSGSFGDSIRHGMDCLRTTPLASTVNEDSAAALYWKVGGMGRRDMDRQCAYVAPN